MKIALLILPSGVRELVAAQLQFLGHVPVVGRVHDVAIVDPLVPGALEGLRGSTAPVIFVTALDPTEATRALAPTAHLTLPYALDDLERALAG